MRQTIGGTWLLGIMILFILLFVGFIILTLNYARAVRLKNEIVSIVERYEGLNENSLELVNNYLSYNTYSLMGNCTGDTAVQGVYGATSLENAELEEARPGANYYYCVSKHDGTNTTNYYQITIFYKFNLPIIGDAGRFTIRGTTSNFQSNDNSRYCYSVDGTCIRGSSNNNYGNNSNNNSNNNSSNNSSNNNTYTVSFDLNGGTGQITSQIVEAGDSASRPSSPSRDGYTFLEWQLNGREYNFNTPVIQNITLIATWEAASRVPTRDEIQGFIIWNDKYYKCNRGDTPVRYCMYGYALRPEYANDRELFTEEVLNDWQIAKGITFTEEEKEEFRRNWR